jgi:cytochrome d ubiquinol oxidase subunit I
MVGLGMVMFFIALIYYTALWKKRKWLESRWLLRLFVTATPMGFIAVEAGWTVTEVGRQPWIIYGIMKTADAVTPMPGIVYSFYLYTAVYISLAVVVTFMLYRQIKMVGALYDTVPPGKPLKP